MKLILGVDPGTCGGVAVFDVEKREVLDVLRFSKNDWTQINWELEQLVYKADTIKAFVEKVSAQPKQGVSSTFKFGMAYGIIQGLLIGNVIPYQLVTPQAWQAGLHVPKGLTHPERKRFLASVARQRFPNAPLSAMEACDSVLIAEYGAKQ
jgi:crossover junction endodeoxyribonuclease RuvC